MKKGELQTPTFASTKLKRISLFALMMSIYSFSLAQTTYTWKFPSVDKEWTNKNNWISSPSGGTFPGDNGRVSDSVVISSGSVVVSSGSYSIAKLVMFPSASASLTIDSGATLNVVGGSTAVVGLQMSPSATAIDTLAINGTLAFTGSFLQALSIGGKSGSTQYLFNKGSLKMNATCAGPAFVFNSSGVNYLFNNSGSINITNSGTNQAAMLSNNGNATFDNSGTISLSGTGRVGFGGASGVFNNMGSFTTDIDFNCTGKFNNKTGGVLTFSALSTASTYNAMQATVVFNNQGGTLNTAPSTTNAIGISGINSFASGTLSPGGLTGNGLMIISAVSPVTSPIALNGTLRIQVNGNKVAGVDYDKISGGKSTGIDIRGAVLDVTGIYTPTKKDTISVVSTPGTGGDSLIGPFNSVVGLSSGWTVLYSKTDVKLIYSNSLPVKMVNFKVFNENGINQLSWLTVEETNNKGFYVQKQSVNGQWVNVGFVKAKGFASSYHFEDKATVGKSFYRLCQVDEDGKQHFSQVLQTMQEAAIKLTLSPNPVADKLHISLPNIDDQPNKVVVIVYDLSGRKRIEKLAPATVLTLV